jgi:hypothetical protein
MKCEGCDRAKNAAIKTLERIGYTYHGGEEWKPPLGEKPNLDVRCVFCSRNLQGAIIVKNLLGKAVCKTCESIIFFPV